MCNMKNGYNILSSHICLSEIFTCIFFFPNSSTFPIQMHATDEKTQKIEPDPNLFMMDEGFGGSL